jgi:hypothetical protein
MSVQHIPRFTLEQLSKGWAKDVGLAQWQTVLRRLCDWAVTDAFPSDAFSDGAGILVEPRHIYRTGRALWGPEDLAVKALATQDPNIFNKWHQFVTDGAAVGAASVVEFCRRTKTAPPSVLGIKANWKVEHPMPPECGCAEAAEHELRAMAWRAKHRDKVTHIGDPPEPRLRNDVIVDEWNEVEDLPEKAKEACGVLAERILNDPHHQVLIKHGWRKQVHDQVRAQLAAHDRSVAPETVRDYCRPTLDQWERTHLEVK